MVERGVVEWHGRGHDWWLSVWQDLDNTFLFTPPLCNSRIMELFMLLSLLFSVLGQCPRANKFRAMEFL